ncbi:hypothetical protein CORC01_05897 [Colletotrichum orchidophilum]|uniref:Large ribosomal subunit protein uL29m n=1 Tax=Colletotrichum orchidophilum TaxID=1209926 RepID=A0A1G4BBN4_9PEZI|nr:uncharacterized protein CORC01_05897 [Colletotrichum orchidophilum]OHE98808.1 hypothetical protein CORC01_05897 [Colletotrichum orchidophilum]
MANPNTMRPSIGRVLRLQETRQWLPTTPTTATQTRNAAACFSTSAAHSVRKTRDNNRLRGVSTMKRSGPREPLSVSWETLPKPKNHKREVAVDPNHGLWDFFYGKNKLMNTPKEDQSHGRAWTVEELRKKNWEDLHSLWYVCLKERNRIATTSLERERRRLGFGGYEANDRDETVVTTMKAIKHVLTERFYLWEDARKLAENDPEVDLSGEGEAYTPLAGYEDLEEANKYLTEEVEAAAIESPIVETPVEPQAEQKEAAPVTPEADAEAESKPAEPAQPAQSKPSKPTESKPAKPAMPTPKI